MIANVFSGKQNAKVIDVSRHIVGYRQQFDERRILFGL
jgi:hypothetical protein